MATSGTVTKTKSAFGLLEVTITGFNGVINITPSFNSEGFPFGSAEIALTSGSATNVQIQLQGCNTGISANFANLGTAATSYPAITALSAASLEAPCKFYQFSLSGGDGTGTFTITCILMGTRG